MTAERDRRLLRKYFSTSNPAGKQHLERNIDIYCDRVNLRYPPTLQELADKHGITRERVRQIEAKYLRVMLRHKGVI